MSTTLQRPKQPFLVRVAATIGEALGAGKRKFISAQSFGFGEWEGSEINRLRRRPPVVKSDEDFTLNYGRRENLLSEARTLCQTKGICRRIIRQYANYVVGTCQARWQTSDEAWNEQAEESFFNWSRNCDIQTRNTLPMLARKHLMGMIRDGDSFARKVDFDGEARLSSIEADRVGNYMGGTVNIDEPRLIGGIGIDALMRPRFYRVWERAPFGLFENKIDVPAAEILHVYDSDRFDSIRGVTHFAPALNHIRDMKETTDAQKAKQKITSRLALMVRNALGGPDQGTVNVLGDDTDAKGASIKTEMIEDGAIKYQFNGDEMHVLSANDPNDGWFKFTDLIIREVSLALDLPYEFVWNMVGLTGPGVRMMSKQAERTFRGKQEILEMQFLDPVCAWWVNLEMQAGRLPFNAEWPAYRFQRPAHPSIDAGRESQANLAELSAGVSTECRIAEEQGEDDEEVAEVRLSEARRKLVNADKLVTEFGVTRTEALDLLGRSNVPKTAALDVTAQQEPAMSNP